MELCARDAPCIRFARNGKLSCLIGEVFSIIQGRRVLLSTMVQQEPSASALPAKVPITAEDCKRSSGNRLLRSSVD
jgi:hypothetical protein